MGPEANGARWPSRSSKPVAPRSAGGLGSTPRRFRHSTRVREAHRADGPRRMALSEHTNPGESKGQTPAPVTDPCFVYILWGRLRLSPAFRQPRQQRGRPRQVPQHEVRARPPAPLRRTRRSRRQSWRAVSAPARHVERRVADHHHVAASRPRGMPAARARARSPPAPGRCGPRRPRRTRRGGSSCQRSNRSSLSRAPREWLPVSRATVRLGSAASASSSATTPGRAACQAASLASSCGEAAEIDLLEARRTPSASAASRGAAAGRRG